MGTIESRLAFEDARLRADYYQALAELEQPTDRRFLPALSPRLPV